MKFNTVNKECQLQLGGADEVSLTNTSCMCLVQRFPAATHSSSLWIMHLPPPLSLFYFFTAKSVWQVPGSVGIGANGREVQIYQPQGQ